MAVSNITVKGLTPILSILGNYQRFTFDDPFSSFQKDALFVPTLGNPSQTNDEHRNSSLSGFRWCHKTLSTDTIGSFTLQSFLNASPVGTDLMRVNQNNTIDFLVPTSLSGFSITANLDMAGFKITDLGEPTLATDAATKDYVDNIAAGTITLTGAVTGSGTGTIATTLTPITTALITNFDAAVTAFRLDQLAVPTSSLSMGNQKIINLAPPTLGTDAVNKDYADALVGGASITLTGAVTGSGSGTVVTTLTPITTTQITNFNAAVVAFRLDQFVAPTTSVSFGSQKLIDLLTPTLATDAATKGYVDDKTWTTSVITDFTTATLAFRLDQFAIPTTSLNLNSQKIINLGVPTLGTDAANKNYVDDKTITLTGAVTGTGVLGSIVTTLTNIVTSQITNFNAAVTAFRLDQFATPTTAVSMGGQKITNLGAPTITTDAATKAYVDSVAGGAITLTGAVTGTGTGTIATTLTNITTSQISNFNAAVTAFRLDQFASPTATVNLNNQVIGNLATPFLTLDAANKSYVDSVGSTVSSSATAFTQIYQRSASCYSPGNNITTNVLTANIPQKINGSTNLALNGFSFDIGINNRIRYGGPQTLFFTVYGSAQVSSTNAGSTTINLELVKNGTTGLLTPFIAGRVQGANQPQIFSIDVAPFQLSTNDFIELYIRASNNTTVTVSNMIWTVRVILN